MQLEGICKVHSGIGMEYQYGEFYIDRDYLVFEQNYGYKMGKRHTYPLQALENIALIPKGDHVYLTFSCARIRFEIAGTEEMLYSFYEELRSGHSLSQSEESKPQPKRSRYTTHHQYFFSK
ncbi:hypothetical protein [Listeria valentina]|uniref:hypothetical protein n=1 Tax=Listeria valentina TaxID=2705293 RepID=UPI001431C562|nr:hypothetical protein [Listeria valentina]